MVEPPDKDICFKIIAATDNKDIWSHIGGSLRTTGCLGGAYGDNLFGNALRSIKLEMEKELSETKSERVKKFCKQEIKNLEKEIEVRDKEHEAELKADIENFEESQNDL